MKGSVLLMFAFENASALTTEENEIKPNLYTAKALQVGIAALVISLILNEANIFHLDAALMRTTCLLALIFALIPQLFAYNPDRVANPITKYVMLGCVCLMTFILESSLFVFAAPLTVLPMLLSVQYNSRRFSVLALIGSSLIAALTPPLGCMLGLWDPGFFTFLLNSALGANVQLTTLDAVGRLSTFLHIFLYVSLPWLMCILMLGRLILSAAQKGEENIQNQIRLLNLSRLDVLTGLYNQNTYKELLEKEYAGGHVGVIFFDVDGLKEINDRHGHDAGDLLLRTCAQSLQPLFDQKCVGLRVGGDEFLVLVDTEDPADLSRKLSKWKKAMQSMNTEQRKKQQSFSCHMSFGTAFGSKRDLKDLISKADTKMYVSKYKYHKMQSDRLPPMS